jgi:hypothetical protein
MSVASSLNRDTHNRLGAPAGPAGFFKGCCLHAFMQLSNLPYTRVMLLVPAVCTDNPLQPGNGSFNCTSPVLPGRVRGHVCNATCDTGYWGAPSATCQPDGTYSDVTGECKLIGGLRKEVGH